MSLGLCDEGRTDRDLSRTRISIAPARIARPQAHYRDDHRLGVRRRTRTLRLWGPLQLEVLRDRDLGNPLSSLRPAGRNQLELELEGSLPYDSS
jgi:hypothetical protein